jgi:hypothetical protein
MSDGLDPTETYDGRIMVHLLRDSQDNEEIPCSSFREAIEVVKKKRHLATVSKIVDRDEEVVFSSANVDIEAWERVWKNEKRRLSVTVEEYDCPYDSISCFADDLCVQCKMDKLQNSPRFSGQ